MIERFEKNVALLHDARVFGFFFDTNKLYEANFYLYIQLFGVFNEPNFHMKRALLRFKGAMVVRLSIENDLSEGQHFITELKISSVCKTKYSFNFSFNSKTVELKLNADDMELVTSNQEELDNIQYLPTNWRSLICSPSPS